MEFSHIQWFPGHMHKARKEVEKSLKNVDIMIEIRDARVPASSANPMLDEIRGDKPCLMVFSKIDLADPERTKIWKSYFQESGEAALFVDSRNRGQVASIPGICQKLVRQSGRNRVQPTAMVVGIPNVGKSSIINALAGRTVAKTGNEPAVTRQQQFVEVSNSFRLLDTPGLMWPKIENLESGYRLAITGAVRDTAVTHLDLALFAIGFFREQYSDNFANRYKLDDLDSGVEEILDQVGRKRGCLVKGGTVDLDKAAKIIIGDIRDGRLGRITWEVP